MTGFLDIKRVILPYQNAEFAFKYLREAGNDFVEGVALFAGVEDGESFFIKSTIVPRQTAYSIERGLLYSIEGDELHRINVHLYENNLSLISQIHSHPKEAYHSETDDAFPIITTVGGLSIVVPNFASDPIDINNWAVYRLTLNNTWQELDKQTRNNLISIIK
jgi:hypothetical protein